MIKIALLCAILVLGYIQFNDTNEVKFLTPSNVSEIRIPQSNIKPSGLSGYYNWLHFLKSSTSTAANNVTILLEAQ